MQTRIHIAKRNKRKKKNLLQSAFRDGADELVRNATPAVAEPTAFAVTGSGSLTLRLTGVPRLLRVNNPEQMRHIVVNRSSTKQGAKAFT